MFYLIGPTDVIDLLQFSRSLFRLQYAGTDQTVAQISKLSNNDVLFFCHNTTQKKEPITDLTNQVGQPRLLSLCTSRRGTMFNSSTRLTMARGTCEQQKACRTSVVVACSYADKLYAGAKRWKHTSRWRMSRACWIRRTTFLGEKKICRNKRFHTDTQDPQHGIKHVRITKKLNPSNIFLTRWQMTFFFLTTNQVIEKIITIVLRHYKKICHFYHFTRWSRFYRLY